MPAGSCRARLVLHIVDAGKRVAGAAAVLTVRRYRPPPPPPERRQHRSIFGVTGWVHPSDRPLPITRAILWGRCRQRRAARVRYQMLPLFGTEQLLGVDMRLPIKPNSRGWCRNTAQRSARCREYRRRLRRCGNASDINFATGYSRLWWSPRNRVQGNRSR